MTTSQGKKTEELPFEEEGGPRYIRSQLDTMKDWKPHDFEDFYRRDVPILLDKIDELECTLDDEETAHLGTLNMIDAANTHSVEMVEIARQWAAGDYDKQPGLRATHQFRLAKYAAEWILERERKNA